MIYKTDFPLDGMKEYPFWQFQHNLQMTFYLTFEYYPKNALPF